MTQIENYGNMGVVKSDVGVFTFEIQGAALTVEEDKLEMLSNSQLLNLRDNHTFEMNGYRIMPYGKTHNNFPIELREIVKENRLLPELLEKQIRFLFGRGPFLYKLEEKDGLLIRKPVNKPKILAWLRSWKKNGLGADYISYLLDVIREFYYVEGIFSKYVFNKSRRTFGAFPVRGLEHVPIKKARFATLNKDYTILPDPEEFNKIMVGDWLYPWGKTFEVFNRFDESNPFAYPTAINYSANNSFAEDLYSYPVFYYGLKEWIKGSNLNPKYINSFLKNSLNAKLHVIIPTEWVESQRSRLEKLCDANKELKDNDKPIMEEYLGIKLSTEFRESMMIELINNQLKKITELMSGEGKNQGKLFSSIKYMTEDGVNEWEFKEIPTKYKEFVESIIKYDERADQVILSGKGLDSSISNISKEGVISKSGADAYYNYLIYINSLAIPEYICTYDINTAIRLNFPEVEEEGVRLGFYQQIPQKQEDTAPQERLSQTANK